jgi:predicted porin
LHSFSLGASATLDYELTLGASFTYNGDTGLTRGAGLPVSESAAYGYAASANYNKGPWTIGGFIQTARSEGDTSQPGDNQLHAVQGGVSYRTSTNVRHFAAVYLYEFDGEDGNTALGNQDGVVALVGTRLNF